jgi:glutamate racemase
MDLRDKPIGIFDSGIGGLTVAAAMKRALPSEHIVYFGDLLHLPYGSKSSRAVLDFTRAAVQFLLARSVKLIVIACNTATSIAKERIEREVDVPVLGVIEPGARAACEVTRSGSIGVIGTQRTIASNAYRDAINMLKPGISVYQKATPLLVPLIEEGWQTHAVMKLVLREYLQDFAESGVDAVVLGCTHYPLIKTEVQEILSDAAVVDSADTTASAIVDILQSGDMLREKVSQSDETTGYYKIYLTDYTDVFKSMGEQILGRVIDDVNIITLNWTEGKINYHIPGKQQ